MVIEPLRDPRLLATVAGWHHRHCVQKGIHSSLERRQAQLQTHLSSDKPLPVTLIAQKGEHALGSVSLVQYRSPAAPFRKSTGGRVWLSNLYVREPLRGRGIGDALINQARAYARKHGVVTLWLFTDEWQDFYRKRGWREAGDAQLSGSNVAILSLAL